MTRSSVLCPRNSSIVSPEFWNSGVPRIEELSIVSPEFQYCVTGIQYCVPGIPELTVLAPSNSVLCHRNSRMSLTES
jgi:hypothetical protein